MKHRYTIELDHDTVAGFPDPSEMTLEDLAEAITDSLVTAGEIVNYEAVLTSDEQLAAAKSDAEQRARMRDSSYTPTVEEALADPAGFVEGMREVSASE